jgi:hypothetical protein
MGRRVVVIACTLLLGSLVDANLPFAQTIDVLYLGCVETTIDRNGDGDFDQFQDETFERQAVSVIVGPALSGEEAFNLSVAPWALQGQERLPMAGDILVQSALLTAPAPLANCQPSSLPLVYWRLRRLGDLTPCDEIFLGTPLPPDFNAIPPDFGHPGIIGSNVCGVLANDHVETNCNINIVRSPVPNVPGVFDLSIEERALLYGNVELLVGLVDPVLEQVDLIIEGTAPDGSGQSPKFRSEIHAELALMGQQPPLCSP